VDRDVGIFEILTRKSTHHHLPSTHYVHLRISIMSAYPILGGTGSTGSSTLQLLSASPKNTINVLVRSKPKLHKIAPSSSNNPNIAIFEGSISDTEVLANCLTGTKAVFLTVAVVDNVPGTTIA
jgi:uncharacterized protein YbjT (DUF2867 family)